MSVASMTEGAGRESDVLTEAMRASGAWLSETAARAATGLAQKTLRNLRHEGRLRAVPARRGPNGGGRDYWYARADVEELGARHSARESARRDGGGDTRMLELEVVMARAEAREQELARVRAEAAVTAEELRGELARARDRMATLEAENVRLRAMVRASVAEASARE